MVGGDVRVLELASWLENGALSLSNTTVMDSCPCFIARTQHSELLRSAASFGTGFLAREGKKEDAKNGRHGFLSVFYGKDTMNTNFCGRQWGAYRNGFFLA